MLLYMYAYLYVYMYNYIYFLDDITNCHGKTTSPNRPCT